MPSDLDTGTTEEIEEERRLLYVAMTRAKDNLHLITPHRFFTHGQPSLGDRHVYASPLAVHTRQPAAAVRERHLAYPSDRVGQAVGGQPRRIRCGRSNAQYVAMRTAGGIICSSAAIKDRAPQH